MELNRLNRTLGGVFAACLLAGSVAGCGGSGTTPTGTQQNNVPAKGGVTTFSATSPNKITASGVPQVIELIPPGSLLPQPVWIPAGISLAAGQPIAVLPANTPYFQNMTGGAPGVGNRDIDYGAPGTVTINGQPSGVTMTDGELNQNLGFPAGTYHEIDTGPFSVSSGGNGAPTLTIQRFEWYYSSNGQVLSFPTGANGYIPANGASNLSNVLNLQFNQPYSEGKVTFTLVDNNGTISQTEPVSSSGTAQLHDYTNVQGPLNIPQVGVTAVIVTHY